MGADQAGQVDLVEVEVLERPGDRVLLDLADHHRPRLGLARHLDVDERALAVLVQQVAGVHVLHLDGERRQAAPVDDGGQDALAAEARHGLAGHGAGFNGVGVGHDRSWG